MAALPLPLFLILRATHFPAFDPRIANRCSHGAPAPPSLPGGRRRGGPLGPVAVHRADPPLDGVDVDPVAVLRPKQRHGGGVGSGREHCSIREALARYTTKSGIRNLVLRSASLSYIRRVQGQVNWEAQL